MGRHARHPTTSATCCATTSSTRAGTRSPSAASPAATARWSARPASAPRSRTRTTSTGARRALRASGTRASPSTTRTSTAAAIRQIAEGPLPPVADPQARHLARPVRQLRLRRLRPLHHLVPGRHRHHRGGRRDPRDRPKRRTHEDARRRRRGEPGRSRASTSAHLELIAGCGQNTGFEAGEYLFREGDQADTFYLVRHGRVQLETFVPGRGAVTIQTVDEGDVVGWSWLFPPYRWHFDARALDLVRAVAFDGACLRGKCDERPRLRLRAARALLAGDARAAPGHPPPAPGRLWHALR